MFSHLSYCIPHLCLVVPYIFKLFVKHLQLLLLCAHSPSVFLDHPYGHYTEVFFRVDCLSPCHSVLLLRLYLIPLFETCSSVASFCLTCSYFYVASGLVTFPDLREVAFWRSSLHPRIHSLLITTCSKGAPYVVAWVLLLWWAAYHGQSGRLGWPPTRLDVRPYLVRRLPAAGWQGQVTRCLTLEPQGDPELLLS